MNSPERVSNTITEFYMNKRNIAGASGDLRRYDLLSVIIIGLPKELAQETDGTKLHRLLGTLFSSRLSVREKKNILSEESKIPVGPDLERRISIMCNLSEAIAEEGLERGLKKGREEGREEGMGQLIANFLKNDNHISHAVKMLGVPEEMVLSVAQKERIEILQ